MIGAGLNRHYSTRLMGKQLPLFLGLEMSACRTLHRCLRWYVNHVVGTVRYSKVTTCTMPSHSVSITVHPTRV
jgi:hypothetical protein